MVQRALVFRLSLAGLAAGMMIAPPASAQVGYQVGGLLSWLYEVPVTYRHPVVEVAHVVVGVAPGTIQAGRRNATRRSGSA